MAESATGMISGSALDLARVSEQGSELLAKMLTHGRAAPTSALAVLISEIHWSMQVLYQNFVRDPRDIDTARNFVRYHAPKAVELVGSYLSALASGQINDEERTVTEEALRNIHTSFKELYAKCLENDSHGLELQSATLDRLLSVQGVTPTPPLAS